MDEQIERMDRARASATTDQDADRRPREIRSEIEQTREDIAETVDAIQEKLRPSNVVASAASATTEKVKDMAYRATENAEEWWDASGGTGLMDRIRTNPVPAVLAGVGLAWLAMSDSSSRSRQFRTGSFDRNAGYGREGQSAPVAQTPPRGMEPPARGMDNARRALRRGSRRLESTIREYPLAVGAAAAILGASVGMAVPETERENEWLGDARESTVQRAREAATGAVDRAKDAAADAVTRAAIGD